MTDDPDSIILRHLRQIDRKVDLLIVDMGDIKHRMTAVEESLGGMAQSLAAQSRRIDRLDERVERIERRLDLVDAPAE